MLPELSTPNVVFVTESEDVNLIIYLSDFMLAEEVTHPDITTIFQQNNI